MASSSRKARIVGVGLVVAVLAAGVGWWYHITRPGYRLARGLEAARQGDFIKANEYATLLERAGDRDHAFLLRGQSQFLQNQPLAALSTLNRIESEGTEVHIEAVYVSGRCLLATRNLRDAERAFTYVIDSKPDHVDARRGLASIYYDLGDYLKAIPLLEEVANLDRTDGRSLRLIGLMYKDMQKIADAVPAYEESLQRDPNPSDASDVRLELAECWLAQARANDVLRILESDHSSSAAAFRAEALISLGRVEEATALLDDALKGDPNHSVLRRLRAERYRAAGDPAAGARLLENVVAKNPNDFRSREQLALCLEAIGKTAEAAEHLRKVRETQDLVREIHEKSKEAMLNTWDPKVRYRLAELVAKLGRPELAQMWQKAAQACRETQ